MALSNRILVFAMFLCAGLFVFPLQAQISVPDLLALEGPWECRNPSGVVGVFITAHTLPTSQSIDIDVYQRQGDKEQNGHFSARTGQGGSTVFDAKRLVVHLKRSGGAIPPFDLDVSFDPLAGHWTGWWSLCNQSVEVVLERPHQAEGVQQSPFVGDWEGYPDPTARFSGAPGSLHIRESYDGHMTAWLDRTIQIDQRNGEQLQVLSRTPRVIVVGAINPFGAKYWYEGSLSTDGKKIAGQWHSAEGDRYGGLNAPTLYRLLDPQSIDSSVPPEKALFERAMAALEAKRFTVANLTFQTLVNTYPDSEYARKAKEALEDPRIANCGEPLSPPACDGGVGGDEPAH